MGQHTIEIEPLRQQEDLFSTAGSLAIDPTFASARRIALDAGSWVEFVPGWMTGSEQLFDSLATAVPWSQHYRTLFEQRFLEPRLTAEYGTLRGVPSRHAGCRLRRSVEQLRRRL